MIRTLLVANRGEIACRVIRTAHRMGIRTVAVHSDADAGALHVAMADESRRIGPAPATCSYLDVGAVVGAARDAGADALHPGYGFLSERAELAEACEAAGLTFVGPPPAVMRAVGDKRAARELMAGAGVPVVEGSEPGEDPAEAARRIGAPLIVKAAAGGGGRGMRVVRDLADLDEGLAAAGREALAAFGDGSLLVERHVDRARHVEVQVVADDHGGVVHLLDRDCSLQRRHQKLVEEAPAPALDPGTRAALREAAVAAARAVGYRNAGTVEFLVDAGGGFAAIEVNARLQVEHPVTEAVTGVDLVEWQLRVAAGEPLPLAQDEVAARGHAVEARVTAEDPDRGLLPSSGRLLRVVWPGGEGIRVDAGVREGDEVTVHYDSLLAKVVAHGRDRDEAFARLRRALSETRILGLATNLPFLAAVTETAGPWDVAYAERESERLLPAPAPAPGRALALACLAQIAFDEQDAAAAGARSPWARADGWRLNAPARRRIEVRDAVGTVVVEAVGAGASAWSLALPGGTVAGRARLVDGGLVADLDGAVVRAAVAREGRALWVADGPRAHRFERPEVGAGGSSAPAAGSLAAPMPGQVIEVLVGDGDEVGEGQALVLLSAMKMEIAVRAPAPGRVAEVLHRAGDQVEEGAALLRLEPSGAPA